MLSISRAELIQAQAALFAAIILQVIAQHFSHNILPGSQYFLISGEIIFSFLIGFTHNLRNTELRHIHHAVATFLLVLISFANLTALVAVLHLLVVGHTIASGEELLASSLAIFGTNIIVFGLWYWEIDSPGLTSTTWLKHHTNFRFVQQDFKDEFPTWRPQFLDFFYVAITNAFAFSPADARPLTKQAKLLMATQSMVSIFTLALVLARAVSVIG